MRIKSYCLISWGERTLFCLVFNNSIWGGDKTGMARFVHSRSIRLACFLKSPFVFLHVVRIWSTREQISMVVSERESAMMKRSEKNNEKRRGVFGNRTGSVLLRLIYTSPYWAMCRTCVEAHAFPFGVRVMHSRNKWQAQDLTPCGPKQLASSKLATYNT